MTCQWSCSPLDKQSNPPAQRMSSDFPVFFGGSAVKKFDLALALAGVILFILLPIEKDHFFIQKALLSDKQ